MPTIYSAQEFSGTLRLRLLGESAVSRYSIEGQVRFELSPGQYEVDWLPPGKIAPFSPIERWDVSEEPTQSLATVRAQGEAARYGGGEIANSIERIQAELEPEGQEVANSLTELRQALISQAKGSPNSIEQISLAPAAGKVANSAEQLQAELTYEAQEATNSIEQIQAELEPEGQEASNSAEELQQETAEQQESGGGVTEFLRELGLIG